MWKYKGTKQLVNIGDLVKVSKSYTKSFGQTEARVVDIRGFITIQFENGIKVDCDSRNITFISK